MSSASYGGSLQHAHTKVLTLVCCRVLMNNAHINLEMYGSVTKIHLAIPGSTLSN